METIVRTKRGKPHLPPGHPMEQTQHTFTISRRAWQNLGKLAAKLNALARTGPKYQRPSWRTWLYRFAMEDIPTIVDLLDRLKPNHHGEMIHLMVDMAQFCDYEVSMAELENFNKNYGCGNPSLLVKKLTNILGSDILVGSVLHAILTTCPSCKNANSGCRCWDDS